MNTDELIANLTQDHQPRRRLPRPCTLWLLCLGLCAIYALILTHYFPLRPDLAAFIAQPLIAIELALMLGILLSSLWVTICLAYPDQYQEAPITSLPLILLGLLMVVLAIQITGSPTRGVLANLPHHMDCFSHIALASSVPAAILLWITQKGATTLPARAGCMCILAAVSMSCLLLRMSEITNDVVHLLLSHYMPIIGFAALGVLLGKRLLRW